jgi:hypothetical protein
MKELNKQLRYIDDPDPEEVERYTLMCNLIEAIWLADNLNTLDLNDLPPLTSDGARRIASFIEDVYTNGACKPSEMEAPHQRRKQ